MAVPRGRDRVYRDVPIPTDGSPGVEPALEHGVGTAARWDATVHALYVVDAGAARSGTFETRASGGKRTA